MSLGIVMIRVIQKNTTRQYYAKRHGNFIYPSEGEK